MWCQAIYCMPPYTCRKFRVGERCCEFECLDDPSVTRLPYRRNESHRSQSIFEFHLLDIFIIILMYKYLVTFIYNLNEY
ncbi:GSCOCG00011404001-RA-CDS [Cotesia congregata]|nr:GSCOCG00011404001-RA-CDS [Cotesia congregata]